jgi:hypothetical protein
VLRPLRLAGAALFGILLAACYSMQPVVGAEPRVGTQIAFDLNDAGRVALGSTMGPEIAQVEGQLVEKQEGVYIVSVSNVRTLRGAEQPWSGERVRLRSDYLGPAYVRKFSKTRSIGAVVGSVGGITAFFLSRSLLGIGTDPDSTKTDTVITRLGRP